MPIKESDSLGKKEKKNQNHPQRQWHSEKVTGILAACCVTLTEPECDMCLSLELAEAGSEDIDILPNGLAFFSVVSTSLSPHSVQGVQAYLVYIF